MLNLDELRNEIDSIDDEILLLMEKRMEAAKKIGQYKRENDLPVLNSSREREILCRVTKKAAPEIKDYVKPMFLSLFEISRSYQADAKDSHLCNMINSAIEDTEKVFPSNAVVACQGVDGSYSTSAAEKLFSSPDIMYTNTFEGVFQAVDSGLCEYGILPLENSTAGSVNEVYDLMSRYSTYIVRSIRLRVQHTLLAKPGIKMSDIKEIISHEQAINQCSNFLKAMPGVKVTACENTAAGAKMASQSERNDIAVISSHECAALYGLSVLSYNIQNSDNNYTRFICISKKLKIYPGAHKTSLILTLDHKPGTLYTILSKFNALNINLNKLESRPISGQDFEFKFYFDIDTSVYSPEFNKLISQLENDSEMFCYLGSYQEV